GKCFPINIDTYCENLCAGKKTNMATNKSKRSYASVAIYRFKSEPSVISNLAMLMLYYSVIKFNILSPRNERNESIYA
ncbi:hypothetical protein DOY81_006412, partial [Sarcophaga bullata]